MTALLIALTRRSVPYIPLSAYGGLRDTGVKVAAQKAFKCMVSADAVGVQDRLSRLEQRITNLERAYENKKADVLNLENRGDTHPYAPYIPDDGSPDCKVWLQEIRAETERCNALPRATEEDLKFHFKDGENF